MDRSDEVSLDINEIATSLRDQLKTNKAFSWDCCIYRVPARLRRLNEEAYTPSVVSIGPFHHGKENLKEMEDHKIMYLQQFLERSKVSVEYLISVVRDNETALRDCYEETIDLSRKDFTTMILLDAVFIIIFLLKYSCGLLKCSCVGECHRNSDQIFSLPWKISEVLFDMCLLENQLPFFFLEELFELYPSEYTIMELTFELLKSRWGDWVQKERWEKINSDDVLHFVDVLKKCQQPKERECQQPKERESSIRIFSSTPTATELHQSGVKFKNPERNSLFDIRFSNGILEIPQLTIHDNTECLLRNLLAFEQCHPDMDRCVTDYIAFMSFLVRAPNDVKVLVRNNNLESMVKSDEAVSNLFCNLDKENFTSKISVLCDVCKDLNSHCGKRRHKWKATLKQVYFNNPWTAISVAAAACFSPYSHCHTNCVHYPSTVSLVMFF